MTETHSTLVLGVDPGTRESAWVLFDGAKVLQHGIESNERVLYRLVNCRARAVVFEQIEAMGMAVGAEVFETVFWTGRFFEASTSIDTDRVTRRAVKLHLCGSMRAKDANIRQALIDKLGPQGTKKAPGPLFGVKSHEWSALAVAVTWLETRAARSEEDARTVCGG